MPFKSDKQRKYFNANKDELEAEGVNVDEWNKSSKGMDLPEEASKDKKKKVAKTPTHEIPLGKARSIMKKYKDRRTARRLQQQAKNIPDPFKGAKAPNLDVNPKSTDKPKKPKKLKKDKK